MKFRLLNAALYITYYNEKEVDKICSKLKGTVYEKRISIVSQFVEWSKTTEKLIFVDINSLEELKELSDIFRINVVLDFDEEPPYIVLYDGYIE